MKKEEYYTAKEAMELLGKPSTSFYREVREGRIPHKGKRPHMRFPKEAIDAIAEVGADKKEEEEKLTFKPSTIADAWTKQEITRQPYEDEDAVPFKTILEWRQRNDEISMSVKLRNRILGWTTFLPVDEAIIVELLYNRVREKDIPPQAIKKWTDKQLSVYIPIIEVISSDDVEWDKEVGAFLLRKTIKWAITLMIQYDIKNWYGIGTTPEGQAILERLGFELITDLEEGKRKGYKLESKAEPVRLVSRFLQSV
jgi:helix-turn-helix protein